eukprot:26822-Pyramimonas_sp.AAC.1
MVDQRATGALASEKLEQPDVLGGEDAACPSRSLIDHGGPMAPPRPGTRGSAIEGPSPIYRRRAADS